MKTLKMSGIALVACLALAGFANAQKWQSLKHPPTFQTDTALQLTDGTVMVHEYLTPNWWRLTPNNTGQLPQWNLVEAGLDAVELWAAVFRFRRADRRTSDRRGRRIQLLRRE